MREGGHYKEKEDEVKHLVEEVLATKHQVAEVEKDLVEEDEEEEDKEKEEVSTTITLRTLTREMFNATPAKSMATTAMNAKAMCSATIARSMGTMLRSAEESNQ